MVDVCCPKCGRIHHVGEEHIGFMMRCAGCGEILPIANGPARPTGARIIDPARSTPNYEKDRGRFDARPRIRLSKPAWGLLLLAAAIVLITVAQIVESRRHPDVDRQIQSQGAAKAPVEEGGGASAPSYSDVPEGYKVLPPVPSTRQTSEKERSTIESNGRKFVVPVQKASGDESGGSQSEMTGSADNPGSMATPVHPRAHRDMSVDLALPIYSHIGLMKEPDPAASRIRMLSASDELVLIDRADTNGWWDVIDVRSGKEGWVNKDDVQLSLTSHPSPAAKFSDEDLGSDGPPDIEVQNQTSGDLTLKVGDASYTVHPSSTLKVQLSDGTYSYHATEPGAIPAIGRQEFKQGHAYTWKFWIETSFVRMP